MTNIISLVTLIILIDIFEKWSPLYVCIVGLLGAALMYYEWKERAAIDEVDSIIEELFKK